MPDPKLVVSLVLSRKSLSVAFLMKNARLVLYTAASGRTGLTRAGYPPTARSSSPFSGGAGPRLARSGART